MSKVNPLSKLWLDNGEVKIYAQELVNTFDIDQANSYKVLRESLNSLWTRSLWLYGDCKDGEKIRWLSRQKYSEGEGSITINFGREVVGYLSGMVDYFTSDKILAASGFKSVYSIRLYELCCQCLNTGWRVISVEDLRYAFGLENEYEKWSDLRHWVLNKAVNEINEKSDIVVSYSVIKAGRNIKAIKILIERNDQYQLPL